MDGLSYADVAGLVGVSKTVVQGRLQRARAQLRRDLGAFEERLRAEPLPQDFSANVGRLLDTAVSQRADRAQASKRLLEMGVGAVPSLCEALDGDTSDAVRLLSRWSEVPRHVAWDWNKHLPRGRGATVNRCVNSSGGFLPVLLVALSDAVDVSDPVGDLRE